MKSAGFLKFRILSRREYVFISSDPLEKVIYLTISIAQMALWAF
jgi:hypothetical protein